jgi:hypothetical protein
MMVLVLALGPGTWNSPRPLRGHLADRGHPQDRDRVRAGLLTISALALTAQTGLVLATGEPWLFLLQFSLANLCMCVLFAGLRAVRIRWLPG